MSAGKAEERYAFVVEWFDQSAQLAKEFRLFFYAEDNSVEMFDPKNRRTFLKRTVYPSVNIADLFIGSAVNVFGRQLVIQAFADDTTKQKLVQTSEKTLLIVKPSSLARMGDIIEEVQLQQFTICRMRMVDMETQVARGFEQLPRDVAASSADGIQGTCLVMELAKNDAVTELLQLTGKSVTPKLAGTYLSPSASAAEREIEYFFSPEAEQRLHRTAHLKNTTLAVIKPHVLHRAHKTGAPGKIIASILRAGYLITDLSMLRLDRVNAEEFLEVYKTVVPEFHLMVDEMTSGPCIAMEITAGPSIHFANTPNPADPAAATNIVAHFRHFVGPYDAEIGRRVRPSSLRALFGEDKVKNAVHCTDLAEDGELEVQYFFQILA